MVGDRFSSFASKIGASIRSKLDRSSGESPSIISRNYGEQRLEEGQADDEPAVSEKSEANMDVGNESEDSNQELRGVDDANTRNSVVEGEEQGEVDDENAVEREASKELAEVDTAEDVAGMVASRETGFVYIQTKSKWKPLYSI
jgi:hypothetical protein